jgi:RNA polymerase-binding transcription factor DksA
VTPARRLMITEEKMHSVSTRHRRRGTNQNATRYPELRRELETELEALVPGEWRTGEEALLELAPRARRRAQQILDILRRMNSEAFGICAGCRSAISSDRLSVLPETRLCARCSWSRELSS